MDSEENNNKDNSKERSRDFRQKEREFQQKAREFRREARKYRFNTHIGPRRQYGALIIVLIGVAILLNRLPINLPQWLFSWQTLIIVIGILIGLRNRFRNWVWFAFVAVGALSIIDNHYVPAEYQNLTLPIVLIVIGIYAFFAHSHQRKRCRRMFEKQAKHYGSRHQTTSDEDVLNLDNIFGGLNRVVLSKNFKGGHISNVFGGVKLNLLKADIEKEATLNIDNTFGGVTLIVPTNWNVIPDISPILGGIDDKRPFDEAQESDDKKLILKGNLVFGGIEILSYDRSAQWKARREWHHYKEDFRDYKSEANHHGGAHQKEENND